MTQDGELKKFGTVRARLGYSFGNFLPYVTAGMMWARLEQGLTCPSGAVAGVCAVTGPFDVRSTERFTGRVAGAGAEYAISNHWSIKGEVLFGNFDKSRYTGTVPVFGTSTTRVDLDLNSVTRFGVNYRFLISTGLSCLADAPLRGKSGMLFTSVFGTFCDICDGFSTI